MPCPGASGDFDLGEGLFPLGSDPVPLQSAWDFLSCLKGVCGLEWGPTTHCWTYFGSR